MGGRVSCRLEMPENSSFWASPIIAEIPGQVASKIWKEEGRGVTSYWQKRYGYEVLRETLTVHFPAITPGAPRSRRGTAP
jgi:hypothetical protein